MALFDWLTKRRKPLSKMTRQELRQQELTLQKDRNLLVKRIEKLGQEKQKLFERGAKEKSPEVRRMMAQEFDLKTTEQLMVSRQLNIRTKEMLTVSRIRMIRENADRAKVSGDRIGMISARDLVGLSKLIENDAVTAEMYQERLDDLMQLGAEIDEGATGVSEAGQAVMDIWEKMDAGDLADASEAFDEADRRVRERKSAAEG
ncbi:MAG: hypothetical protein JXQ73_33055 [Phycisphaerae bacterium]|nr:hypothetical protein [Phycisphaerae bacterium]